MNEHYIIHIAPDPSGQWIWNIEGIESGFAATLDDSFARAKLALRRHRRNQTITGRDIPS